MFELEGDAGPAGDRLQAALHEELVARGLVGHGVASISELRLAMGCRGDDVACLARGGRAMGLRQMVVGRLDARKSAYVVTLRLVAVSDPTVTTEAVVPLDAAAVDDAAMDATAIDLADQLFPGTTRPAAHHEPVVAAAPFEPDVAPATAPERRLPAQRSLWVGFGTSLGVATVFAATAIGLQAALRTSTRDDLIAAVDASDDDANPDNDVSRGEPDLCAAARESPMNDGNVTNASVTKICNRADGLQRTSIVMASVAGVALVPTIVFAVLLAVKAKRRAPRRSALVPSLRLDRGATLMLSGRF